MTDTRDPRRKLLRDVQRFKQERNEARAELARTRTLADQLRRDAVALAVRGRLLRLEDFHVFIGLGAVLDQDGRVDPRAIDRRVDDLLRRRPELAA
ncbi:hypothetical protein [Clavibacter zhangzhiyongii]|uniref:hypothetical protein n=1 Tax=Clavibacter zhangzhiyongii TaxID=2768071 RepID=UPI0039E1AE5E